MDLSEPVKTNKDPTSLCLYFICLNKWFKKKANIKPCFIFYSKTKIIFCSADIFLTAPCLEPHVALQILAKLKPKHLKVVGSLAMVRNSVGSGQLLPSSSCVFVFRNARLSPLSWQCASSPRLLRGRRAGGFPRRPQSEGGQHGRRGPHGDGGPAVRDEGEGAEAWGNPRRFLHHPNPSLSWLWSCDCVRVYRRCRKFLQSSSPLPLWLVMPSEPWDPTTQWVLLGH